MELRSDISKKYLAQALFILLKSKLYEDISIQDIVNKAGLSRMAYYRNFASKDEVLKYLLHHITQEFISHTNIDFLNLELREYCIILFEHLSEQKELGKLLFKNNILHFVKAEFDKAFCDKAKNRKELFNYMFISGGLFNIYQLWFEQGCKETPEELANLLTYLPKIL